MGPSVFELERDAARLAQRERAQAPGSLAATPVYTASFLPMTNTITDLDAFTIPPFSRLDGIEGVCAADDRAVGLGSHHHANADSHLAAARAGLAEWEATRDLLEKACVADRYAPKSWSRE